MSNASTETQQTAEEPTIDELLGVLQDTDCREIVAALKQRSMTADQIADCCDIPLSTVYRKLGLLESTPLVQSRVQIDGDGKHRQEYYSRMETVTISCNGGVLDIAVEYDRPMRESKDGIPS